MISLPPSKQVPFFTILLFLAALVSLPSASCVPGTTQSPPVTNVPYRGYLAVTLKLGQSDNSEAIKIIPKTKLALLLASKARKLTLIEVEGEALKLRKEKTLFPNDTSEGETTHLDVSPDGTWAVLTHTLIEKGPDGKTTKCGGELLFVDITPTDSFGTILKQIPVGPMPDSVDISGDGKHVVSANERDVVWGKCENVPDMEPPSISILDVSGGPAKATEIKRILMKENMSREPESIRFSKDNDLVAVTLQDSHEAALFRLSAIKAIENPTDKDLQIVALPKNSLGKDAWPDGITRFEDAKGEEFFGIAGEANDTFIILDTKGKVVQTIEMKASDFPADYPKDGSWGPLFVPDSVASFKSNSKSYLTITLKGSGAIGIWDVSDLQKITFAQSIKVGLKDEGSPQKASTVGVEGVAASEAFGFLLTANEQESSVSLILPEKPATK